ncbi:MAG: beta strand repeat-containing protein [Vicinamibacterales bacterium]
MKITRYVVAATLALPVMSHPLLAQVQNDPRQGWSVTGQVFDLVRVDNTIYAAGTQNLAAALTAAQIERAILLDPTTAFPDVTDSLDVPEDGVVNALISDGGTGWYVGGTFTRVGSTQRNILAHLTPAGVDTSFAPQFNGGVNGLAKQGTTLFVVGTFTTVNGLARGGGAAFDLGTGTLLAWNPQLNIQPGQRTASAVVVVGTTAFVGGTFTTASGAASQGLAAVDATTGALLATPALSANGNVNAFLASGTTVYIGGGFSSIGGVARANVAAIDATTGLVLPFQADTNGQVRSFLLDGTSLFVGGGFGAVAGLARPGVGRVDAITGAVDSFKIDVIGGPVVSLLKVGGTLYAGGFFTHVLGEPRLSAAAVTIATATLLPWHPGLAGGVNGLGLATTGEILAAGSFTHIAGVPRSGVVAVDFVTNELLPFTISVNANVRGLAVVGNTLYLAGQFSSVNGQTRNGFAAVDRLSGALLPWNPNATGSINNVNGGRSIVVVGATAYLGGHFTSVGGAPRTGFAQVDAATGAVSGVFADTTGGGINRLVLNGQTLYAGGTFVGLAGQARQYLAALDLNPTTPALLPLSISLASGGTTAVNGLKVVGSTIYFAGLFSSVNGTPRANAAAVDATTGALAPFAPALSSTANDVDVLGNVAYVAGSFNNANGSPRALVAALNATSGANLPFAANVPPFTGNRVLASSEGLLVGSNLNGAVLMYFPTTGPGGLPGRPTAPVAVLGNPGVFVFWGPPAVGGDVTGYLLEIGTGPGLANIATVPAAVDDPSFVYDGVVPPGLYYARVRAQSASGVGPASPEMAFSPAAGCRGMAYGAALQSAVSGSEVSLSWATPPLFPGPLSYTLAAGTTSGSSNVGAFPLGATNAFATPAPPGAYFLRLHAQGPCGVAAVAGELLLSVGGVVPLAAPVVTGSVAAGVVSLAWNAVSGATGYVLEAGFGPNHTFLTLPLGATALQANAPPGTYYVRVYAIGGPTGRSAASNETIVVVP